MLTIESKVLAASVYGVDIYLMELNATSVSDLPENGEVNGMKLANGSRVMITGSTDTGAFYVFDEENTEWNKAGGLSE